MRVKAILSWLRKEKAAPVLEPTPPAVAPRPLKLKSKPLHLCETIGEKLEYLCQTYGGTAERTRFGVAGVSQVRLCIHLVTGDTVCGLGNTTEEAFYALAKRLGVERDFPKP